MTVRTAVIGCGKIAQTRHIPEFAANENAELCALYDPTFSRAAQLAEQYGCRACTTIEELLADPDIDAVSVCTANYVHAPITVAALKAGKHVLCEKPMAVTIEECEEMVRTAKECGRYLMIAQNQRLAKAHVKARELIAGGAIGRILTFRTSFGHGGPEKWSINPGSSTWFFDRKKAAFGVMADLGIHKTDLIQYLLNDTVTETQAVLSTLDKRDDSGELIGVDDNAVCIYKMASGVTGTMTASWTYYGAEDNSTVIYGTEGILRIYDDPGCPLEQIYANGRRISYDTEPIQTNDHQTSSGVIDLFVDCLVNDREPEISGESVLTAMRAVFGSIEASRTGYAVKVNQKTGGNEISEG